MSRRVGTDRPAEFDQGTRPNDGGIREADCFSEPLGHIGKLSGRSLRVTELEQHFDPILARQGLVERSAQERHRARGARRRAAREAASRSVRASAALPEGAATSR